jgi:hypothetical protein
MTTQTQNAETAKTNGQTPSDTLHRNDQDRANEIRSGQAEQEMLFKLKGAIDQHGRYSYRLNDLSTGYAAGRGVPIMSARHAIEHKFEQEFGISPKMYLDQHYEERREMGQENERDSIQAQIQERKTTAKSRGR